MSLDAAIEQACQYFDKPPSNEKNTELRVVLPLLQEMGYSPHDIDGGGRDVGGYFPDYTLLPEQPDFTWYIEVKAWQESLDGKGKDQAIGYAHRNGKRWVVLTNGQVWRLYDNYIHGVADRKLVIEASLTDKEATLSLLTALSKPSMCGSKLEAYVFDTRLQNLLSAELARNDSRLLSVIAGSLKADYSFGDISNAHIAQFFQARMGATNLVISPVPPRVNPQPLIIDPLPPPLDGEYTFDKIVQQTHTLARRKPLAVRFEGVTQWTALVSWAEFVAAVVEWIAAQGKLPPLPFQPTQGSRYFLNTTPYHVDASERMRTFKEVQTASGSIYASTNTSTLEKVGWLCALCEVAGVTTTDIFVRLD